MANALLIAPLNAANFESGAAEAGQVLSADGSGGATWETPAAGVTSGTGYASAILVAGAGEASVNGIYLPAGTYGGKTKYVLVGGTNNERIEWGEWGDAWNIKADGTSWYYAYDAVDTPDLVETWSKDNGSSPVPTVVDYSSYPDGHVLTADGSGGAAWEAPALVITSQAEPGTILVSGAGTASLNGVYRPVGVNNEKPSYALIGGSNGEGIEWQGMVGIITDPHWIMFDDDQTAYYSLDDVDTPDLATTWQIEDGAAPAPNTVEALANYPAGYVPAADGSGGAVWSPINAGVVRSEVAVDGHVLTADGEGGTRWRATPFPQVVSSVEWVDALTAWNDISASQGVLPPPTDGLTPGASIYLTLRAAGQYNWALLEVHVDATYEPVAAFVHDFAETIWYGTSVEITSIAMALP